MAGIDGLHGPNIQRAIRQETNRREQRRLRARQRRIEREQAQHYEALRATWDAGREARAREVLRSFAVETLRKFPHCDTIMVEAVALEFLRFGVDDANRRGINWSQWLYRRSRRTAADRGMLH